MTLSEGGARGLKSWAPLAGALSLIGMATLVPVRSDLPGGPPFWCVACGDYGLADLLANVALFAPLGWAIAHMKARAGAGLALVVAATICVEWLQYSVVPGRVASSSDVVANTVGGGAGMAVPRLWRWITASGARAAWGAAVYGAVLIAGVGGGLAIQAVPTPSTLRWAQETPRIAGYTAFTGASEAVWVNGSRFATHAWIELPEPQPRGQVEIAVDVVSQRPDPRRAEIISAHTPGQAWMWVDQRDRDLGLHLASASDGLGFRGHSPWITGVMPAAAGERLTIEIVVRRYFYRLVVRTNQGAVVREAGISPGDGWGLLTPLARDRERWAPLLSGVWMAVLLTPLGYLAARRSGTAVVVASVGAAVCLVMLPLVSGCVWLSPAGWCGAAGGLGVGAGAVRLSGWSAA